MRRALGWIPVAMLVGLVAALGYYRLHQTHIKLFLVTGCLATFVVMLSFFWIARQTEGPGARIRPEQPVTTDLDDQNF